MAKRKSIILLALFVLLISAEAVRGQTYHGDGDNYKDGGAVEKGDDSSNYDNDGGVVEKQDDSTDDRKEKAKGDGKGKEKSDGGKGDGKEKGDDDRGKRKEKGDDSKGAGKKKGDDDRGKGKEKGEDGRGKGKKKGDDDRGKGKEKGDDGRGKGKKKGDSGKGDKKKKDDGKGNKGDNGKGKGDPNETNYDVLTPSKKGHERAFCRGKGACFFKTLECPKECPERKPKKNRKKKACFINCGSKCEAVCKRRKPNCNGYGSLCYDPRFVGGDGVMFYFHGAKGGNFAIVSDDNLQINAHFIGTRPQGRTRDFTWVQALAFMYDTHSLIVSAKRVARWDDKVDALLVKYDGEDVVIPIDGEAEWKNGDEDERAVVIERTDDTNSVRVTINGLVEIDIKVRDIGKQENEVHKYGLPEDDAFAHLEMQVRDLKTSNLVEGVLGKTYQPGYVSPVKRGVPMPMMGGEDKYQTPSLYSPVCKVCRFQRPSEFASV